jgi:predicted dehydrogenase
MIAQAQAVGRTLAVAHTYRFFRNRAHARALYRAGQFGRLLSACVDQGDPYSWPTRTAYTLRKEWVLGGVLFNEGVHIVDMLLWWFGAPERFDYADDSLGGLESNVRLTLHYPEGATVNFRLSRTCSLANRVEMRFEKAKITFPIYNMSDLDLTVGDSDPVHLSVHQKPWDFAAVAAAQLADFTLTATQGLPSEIPGEAGLAVVALIEACYESKARRPRPEQIPPPGFTW